MICYLLHNSHPSSRKKCVPRVVKTQSEYIERFLGPNTGNFPSSWTRFTLLTELNLTVPKARPEAHTFDFIGSGQGPFVTLEQNGLWQSL